MKILVIDDSTNNQNAATAQLSGHEVTVAKSYDEGHELLKNPHDFETVLVDLLMPASGESIGSNEELVGMEMPVGIFLGLLAAVNGAKYVMVFTDTNHHSHPASACFDPFNLFGEDYPFPFVVAKARFMLSNARNWVSMFYKADMSKGIKDNAEYEKNKEKLVCAKNWKTAFDWLTQHDEKILKIWEGPRKPKWD